jgi:NAD(P)-dependent dehydrogenase (short-subunit alcohol dehydrogenase family)
MLIVVVFVWENLNDNVFLNGVIFYKLGISVCKLDVTDKDAIFALAEELGTVDILFNCAG